MRLLAAGLAALLLPAAAHAGAGDAFVQIPCYPENRFELCEVPAFDVHDYAYPPRTVPSAAVLTGEGARFAILVTPNAVPYEYAVVEAAAAAIGYCGRTTGERIVARIDERERYAPENLESWRFGGTCE